MKTFMVLMFLLSTVTFDYSQSLAGVELIKEGKKSEWKWVVYNNHKKAVVLEIKKVKTDCDGNVTTTITKRTIYSTANKEPQNLDDYGFKCSGSEYYNKQYTVLSKKFKE